MQTLASVKVVNENSEYVGQYGYVVRTERKDGKALVMVRLDTQDGIFGFEESELEAKN